MPLYLRILLFPIFVVIGILSLMMSIPFLAAALFATVSFGEESADWFFDHLPFSFWMDFVENLR